MHFGRDGPPQLLSARDFFGKPAKSWRQKEITWSKKEVLGMAVAWDLVILVGRSSIFGPGVHTFKCGREVATTWLVFVLFFFQRLQIDNFDWSILEHRL